MCFPEHAFHRFLPLANPETYNYGKSNEWPIVSRFIMENKHIALNRRMAILKLNGWGLAQATHIFRVTMHYQIGVCNCKRYDPIHERAWNNV
jgi:hypothetical protein